MSQLSCTACELYLVCATRDPYIFCVLHNSRKHACNTLCAAYGLVFLCAACELTSILSQRRIKAYNKMARYQNVIKHMDTKKIAFCQVFAYSYSNLLWMTLYQTNWMPNMVMAQGLDSTSTNLTHAVTQCTHEQHKVHIRCLNWGTSTSSLIVDKMHSLHNKLRRCDVNMVSKCKQVHVLTGGLVV